jgi:hypothetical protein
MISNLIKAPAGVDSIPTYHAVLSRRSPLAKGGSSGFTNKNKAGIPAYK